MRTVSSLKRTMTVLLTAALLAASAAGCGKTGSSSAAGSAAAVSKDEAITSGTSEAAGAAVSTAVSGKDAAQSSENAVDAKIEYVTLGGSGENGSGQENTGDGGAGSGASTEKLPQFVTESGESTKALEDLNEELDTIRDKYEEIRKQNDGTWMEIRSFVAQNDRYLQVTTAWNTYPTYGTQGDLMTLAYDRQTDTAIRCEDALVMTGLTGDQLSQDVNQAYVRSGMAGEVQYTGMEGFVLEEDGTVSEIYMKLRIKEEQADVPYEAFFSYDPVKQTIKPAFEGLYEDK
jgi:hypothetical protein